MAYSGARPGGRAALTVIAFAVILASQASSDLLAQGPRAFDNLDPRFTQAIVGVVPRSAFLFPDDPDVILGGVAFVPRPNAPFGIPVVTECYFSGTRLHLFDTTQPATLINETPVFPDVILPSAGGCGIVNHPDGTLYVAQDSTGLEDPATGIANVAANGGPIRTLGPRSNALSIAVDPLTSHLVYMNHNCGNTSTGGCGLIDLNPANGAVTELPPFDAAAEIFFADGLYFDPTGEFLFLANRENVAPQSSNALTVLRRAVSGGWAWVQNIAMGSEPDGVAFYLSATERFVVTNNTDGTLTQFTFPDNDYTQPATMTTIGDNGFRGDLTQVGADGCLYVTQHGARFNDGTDAPDFDSLVKICPVDGGFVPPEGVADTVTPPAAGSLSGFAFHDADADGVRDPGEAGLSGVVITLSGGASDAKATSADGSYSFTGLGAANYSLSAPGIVGAFSLHTPGTLNATLAAGQSISELNFGYVTLSSTSGLALSKLANPSTYSYVGQEIVYTYVVRNTGAVTLSGPFTVTDDKLGTFACGTTAFLAPGASLSCTKRYTIRASDLGNVTSLPTGVVANINTGLWLQGVISTQDTSITGAGPGVPNGVYPGWCIQDHVPTDLHNQPGTLYSSVGGSLPQDVAGLPWNEINYVLNHKLRGVGKTDLEFFMDVQTAIWLLLGEPNPDFGVSAEARQMVNDANAHPDFVPGPNDAVAVVIYSDGMPITTGSIQESIVEMKPARSIVNRATVAGSFGGVVVRSAEAQAIVTQTLTMPPVDAMAWGDHPGAWSVSTFPFSTPEAGRLLLAFVSADAPVSDTNTTVTKVTGAGLTWQLVVRSNTQLGTAEIWRALATSKLTNVSITATLSSSVASAITVMSFNGVDMSGTNGSGAIGGTKASSGSTGAPTVTLTRTRDYSWVFGVGTDWDNPIPRTVGPNQGLIREYMPPVGDTYWVQRAIVTAPSGTPVTLNDVAPTTDRWNFAAVEVLPVP